MHIQIILQAASAGKMEVYPLGVVGAELQERVWMHGVAGDDHGRGARSEIAVVGVCAAGQGWSTVVVVVAWRVYGLALAAASLFDGLEG